MKSKTFKFREPINGLTHLIGCILSIFALIFMIQKVIESNLPLKLGIISVLIFGFSLILLYSASTTYHSINSNDETIAFLRRLDHSMIFILIAGTYMPFCLLVLKGPSRIIFTSLIAILTIIGIIFKMFWFNCPRTLSTSIYIFMGWISVVIIVPLYNSISLYGVLWLIFGGISYTIGGIIYAIKPKFLTFKNWGFHEIFHLFILLGSLCHFICIYFYVL
ncbi:MAG: PAQR family membrane homeostasis protein TrhA [Sarcina sp.]